MTPVDLFYANHRRRQRIARRISEIRREGQLQPVPGCLPCVAYADALTNERQYPHARRLFADHLVEQHR